MARRVRHEEHENHERWLVSYADFITLLFAFFVVMYALSSINEGKYRVLSDSLVSAFKQAPASATPIALGKQAPSAPVAGRKPIATANPTHAASNADRARNKRATAEALRQALDPLVKAGQVRVTETARGISVEINSEVLFTPGEARLEETSIASLSAMAGVLSGVDNAVEVEGHTDSLPIATAQYPSNWELSGARAGSVVRLFSELGVTPARMLAKGFSDTRALAANDLPEGRARNRRVTVMILDEAAPQP
jgi:chemotaxis protein MotB